jgi:putative Ca2+/H+ antiporter (TMEM165/GDT1 family)
VSGFLYAFLAVLLAGFGARDQSLLGQMTLAQGRRPLVLVVALCSALAATAVAGWAGAKIVPETAGGARTVIGAIALVIAGAEMVVFGPPRAPAEPTRSLFAAGLVFAGWQMGDAARLLVLALGVATAAPVPAAIGGAAASMAVLSLGWAAPSLPLLMPLRRLRIGAGILLMLVGALMFIA